MVKCDNLKIR